MTTSQRPVVLVLDPDKVRRARLARGYPERALSGILSVSNRVIHRLEHGTDQSELDLRFVAELAAALDCDVADLLAGPPPGTEAPGDAPDASDVVGSAVDAMSHPLCPE